MKGRIGFFMVLGALVGVGLLEANGLLPGLFLGWLLGDYMGLRERLAALEHRIEGPTQTVVTPAPLPRKPGWAAAPLVTGAMSAVQDAEDIASAPGPRAAVPEAPRPRTPRPIPPTPGLAARLLALLGGGNPLVRIGVLLLFFGVAFLFKYVSQTVSVPLELRFIGTALLGLALLAVGWRLHDRSRTPDQPFGLRRRQESCELDIAQPVGAAFSGE